MDLKNSRFLVTGGAGLIGSTIVDQLLRTDAAEIVVLDNFDRGTWRNLANAVEDKRVRVIDGNILDREVVKHSMEGIDIVFHQAAIRITQCAEDPRLAVDVLVNGTFNVLEAAVAASVKRLIAASSASVYGMAEEFPTIEDHHPYNNRTIYGAAKVFNEGMLRSFHDMYGLSYVALRYFNVYGPRMDIHGAYTEVLIRWMDRIANNEPPIIFGDGSQTMDFVYSEDIARANIMAAISDREDRVYNVASGEETSLKGLAEALLHVMGSDLPVEFGPERKINSVPRRLASTTAARDELGFAASISLEQGLRKLVDWWQTERRRNAR